MYCLLKLYTCPSTSSRGLFFDEEAERISMVGEEGKGLSGKRRDSRSNSDKSGMPSGGLGSGA